MCGPASPRVRFGAMLQRNQNLRQPLRSRSVFVTVLYSFMRTVNHLQLRKDLHAPSRVIFVPTRNSRQTSFDLSVSKFYIVVLLPVSYRRIRRRRSSGPARGTALDISRSVSRAEGLGRRGASSAAASFGERHGIAAEQSQQQQQLDGVRVQLA